MSKQIGQMNELDCLRSMAGNGITATIDVSTLATAAKQNVPVTVVPNAVTDGGTATAPIGAYNLSVVILTGTGTVGGVDLPVGIPYTEPGPLKATVAVVCGSPGTARVFWSTP